jgi:hypothetical protein
MPREKSPHEGERAHDCRVGEAALRAQESLIVPEKQTQRGSVWVELRWRTDPEVAQKRQQLPASGEIAAPLCVATVPMTDR